MYWSKNKVHYSLHLAFAHCVLPSYGAAQLQRITWADQTKPAYGSTSKTSSDWKIEAIFMSLCVCLWWFNANSCLDSSLRQIDTSNKAHHAPVAAAICIERLMLDKEETCAPEGEGT